MSFRDWYGVLAGDLRREKGQTMVEYGFVYALTVLGVLATMFTLGGGVRVNLDLLDDPI
jgi:Flp pilus assembly pilin Flp